MFKKWRLEIESQPGSKNKWLRSDNKGEYDSISLRNTVKKMG